MQVKTKNVIISNSLYLCLNGLVLNARLSCHCQVSSWVSLMVSLEMNCRNVVPMHPNVMHCVPIQFPVPFDMTQRWPFWCWFWFIDCHFRMILCVPCHCWFRCNIAIEIPLSVSFWIPIGPSHGVWGLSVYHLTMAIDQSSRWVLVLSAEWICGLLIYILVNLTPVDVWHPTTTDHDHEKYSRSCGDHSAWWSNTQFHFCSRLTKSISTDFS